MRNVTHVADLATQLKSRGTRDGDAIYASLDHVMSVLHLSQAHAKAILDLLDAVAPYQVIKSAVGNAETTSSSRYVNVHALSLFLMTQLYDNQQRREAEIVAKTIEVWPGSPGSPGGVSGGVGGAGGRSAAHYKTHMQQSLAGFSEFLRRELAVLIRVCQAEEGSRDVTASQLEHLSILLYVEGTGSAGGGHAGVNISPASSPTASAPSTSTPTATSTTTTTTTTTTIPTATPNPTTTPAATLVSVMPCFVSPGSSAPVQTVLAWLSEHLITPTTRPAASPRPAPPISPAAAATHSNHNAHHNAPLLDDVWSATAEEISGAGKETVVRGEDACPSGCLRISGCTDSTIYALCPVQYCLIQGCTNCTILVGAVGRMIRLDKCEDTKVVVACKRITVNSCHDCALFLGTNRPPYLTGDTRGIQVAPYCTRYERLQAHMDAVRISPLINYWDQPLTLSRPIPGSPNKDNRKSNKAWGSPSGGGGKSPDVMTSSTSLSSTSPSTTSSVPAPAHALPPEQLLPFVVPFRGGPGPLAGGCPSRPRGKKNSAADDLGLGRDLVGLPGAGAEHGVFPLPLEYAHALQNKLTRVSELRGAVKGADLSDERKLELQTVVQMWFKEWLSSTGNIKQVQDIASLEKLNAESVPTEGGARKGGDP